MGDWEAFVTMLAVLFGGLIIFVVLYVIISHILTALICVKIFRLFGTCNPVYGWVPFLNLYMLGKTCNGKNGENPGIFGVRCHNWFWNYGWATPLAVVAFAFVLAVFTVVTTIDLSFFSTILGYSSQAVMFLWWCSIYSFIYSRMEGRYENEVRVIAIVSWLIGIVALAKILGAPNQQVYSLENDMYPVDTANDGGAWGGGYNAPVGTQRQQSGAWGGHPQGQDYQQSAGGWDSQQAPVQQQSWQDDEPDLFGAEGDEGYVEDSEYDDFSDDSGQYQ